MSIPIQLTDVDAALSAKCEGRSFADLALIAGNVWNPSEVLQRIGNDHQLLSEMVELFLLEHREALQRIRRAVEDRDPEALAISAHSLKGSVSNFCADDVTEVTAKLETLGREGDLSTAATLLNRLENLLSLLDSAMRNATARTPDLASPYAGQTIPLPRTGGRGND